MAIASINPATGEMVKEFAAFTAAEIETALTRAADAFQIHRHSSFAQRAERLNKVAALLEEEKESLARIVTLEMGKLHRDAIAEVVKCAGGCRFYAEHAEQFLAEQPVQLPGKRSYIRYEPLGVILAIMPWNFPLWQVFRFAAPTLMAGNVALLKHAANVPQCALAIEDIFRRAGFDAGVFQTLLIETDQTRGVIADARVRAVTLTGSDRAGGEVASIAARQIKKAVLELGGNDPFIVMPSADLKSAVATAIKARTINTGQSCIAAKRFILHQSIHDQFVEEFVRGIRALTIGDPSDESTEIGPLATEHILLGVDEQVQKSIAVGAKLICGGRRDDRPGFFYEPTVLIDVPHASPAAREEIFGPVAAFFRASDADEAIAIANDSVFGLGASAWTTDASEQELFASRIEAGMVFINEMVASDPRLPFGGMKRSGYGRELGRDGILEFVNVKTVVIAEEHLKRDLSS